MKAIYRKELKSYLTSMIGYLFMAFILFLFGLYFTAINIQQAYPEIGYALGNASFVFLIAVPILTMKVISEEKKNKTDQLLLTAPVKLEGIVLGKYLALITIFAIPVGIISLYPVMLAMHGTISYPMAYTSVLGFFLLGAAYISIGVFLSSVTESQVIAAVLSFVVLFFCYMESAIAEFFPESAEGSLFSFIVLIALVCLWIGSMIKNIVVTGILAVCAEGALLAVYFVKSSLLEGKIQDFFEIFNLSSHLNNFVNGMLDIQGIIYFLSVIVICIFLTIQSLQKKRWN
ncbi:MAG: ABC-2 transporter permease [Fusicatenibacter sp.]|nr:ABC-2 transporter permease [Lachnospiraceae bacterium]MDY2936966.1 ABC-2 transporter permease [Fusicatenibacter sp.]